MARKRREREELDYFRFDAVAWLTSQEVSAMVPAQEGAYIRLLAICFRAKDCTIPDDDFQLASLSRLGPEWSTLGQFVKAQFKPDPERPGRLMNEKLRKEWHEAWDGYRDRQDRNAKYQENKNKERARGQEPSPSEDLPPIINKDPDVFKTSEISLKDANKPLKDVSPLTGTEEGEGTVKGTEEVTHFVRDKQAGQLQAPPVSARPAAAAAPQSIFSAGRRTYDAEMLDLVDMIAKADAVDPLDVWSDAATGEGHLPPRAIKLRPADMSDEQASRALLYLRDRWARVRPREVRPAWQPHPDAEEVLAGLKRHLERSVTPHLFATWFRPWVGVGWDPVARELRVHVPNAQNVEWVQKNFRDQLRAALAAAGIAEPRLVYEFDRPPPSARVDGRKVG